MCIVSHHASGKSEECMGYILPSERPRATVVVEEKDSDNLNLKRDVATCSKCGGGSFFHYVASSSHSSRVYYHHCLTLSTYRCFLPFT